MIKIIIIKYIYIMILIINNNNNNKTKLHNTKINIDNNIINLYNINH